MVQRQGLLQGGQQKENRGNIRCRLAGKGQVFGQIRILAKQFQIQLQRKQNRLHHKARSKAKNAGKHKTRADLYRQAYNGSQKPKDKNPVLLDNYKDKQLSQWGNKRQYLQLSPRKVQRLQDNRQKVRLRTFLYPVHTKPYFTALVSDTHIHIDKHEKRASFFRNYFTTTMNIMLFSRTRLSPNNMLQSNPKKQSVC